MFYSGEPKRCYSHDEVDLSFKYDPNIEDIKLGQGQMYDDAKAVTCDDGICFVEETVEVTDEGW